MVEKWVYEQLFSLTWTADYTKPIVSRPISLTLCLHYTMITTELQDHN